MGSNRIFLFLAIAVLGYSFLRGGQNRFAEAPRQLNYDTVAVSDGMTAQAAELDLAEHLDVALLPDIGKGAFRAAAEQGLKEQAFLEAVLRDVSNRVREMSTIDLNEDGVVDPVLVRPEPSQEEAYVLLSLRVPAPEAYPLPSASDTAAWKNVETFEVATMSVSMEPEKLTVQASGNPQMYPNSAANYTGYDTGSSFLQTYMAIRMMEWMFFPRMYGFWGPGYGYGGYRPMSVPMAANQRSTALGSRGYGRAPSASTSAIRTRGGGAPRSAYARAYSATPPRSLQKLKTSRRMRTRTATNRSVRSGGFGRSQSMATQRGSGGVRRNAFGTRSRGLGTRGLSKRGFGGFGRRGFGGFGRRGFGGFRFRR